MHFLNVIAAFATFSSAQYLLGYMTEYPDCDRTTMLWDAGPDSNGTAGWSAADKQDFVGYCIAWHDCLWQHHHYEETESFPSLDKAAGRKGLMAGAVDQHATFHDGPENFKSYLTTKESRFSHVELLAIMDSFSEALHTHLKEEPQTIADLAHYNSPETPIDIMALAAQAGKKQVDMAFLFNILPVFFLNMESVQFEDGLWHGSFPPVSKPVKWIMTKGAPMWQHRRWRFASCTPDGEFKRLAV
ncbi:hypothetical protein HYALB_00004974 [Hymenoscyphus albidus]|uniref:Hemerythrin-like domain-containing protein n=1 Tax=Hymenoscyphus albidus TaxID=595503 RepID=A0A9N9LXY8_9HELO|nr:hypothetical protein HYALB_00004974 [Hymenoscyphus albidus]